MPTIALIPSAPLGIIGGNSAIRYKSALSGQFRITDERSSKSLNVPLMKHVLMSGLVLELTGLNVNTARLAPE